MGSELNRMQLTAFYLTLTLEYHPGEHVIKQFREKQQ